MQVDPRTMLRLPTATLSEVMRALDQNRLGVVLIVNERGSLVGTVTDGDIRRFLLAGGRLEAPAGDAMGRSPVTAPLGSGDEQLEKLLRAGHVRVVPLVDADGRPVRLMTVNELLGSHVEETVAVIMAGGQGLRLRPLTEQLPKPLVLVGGEPILDGLIKKLGKAGVRQIYLAVNYRRELVEDRFGDGAAFGVRIEYLREDTAAGTAGALSLLPAVPSQPFLLLNGDIVTEVDFVRMRDYHHQHRAVLTVGAAEFSVDVPYGVLRLAGHHVLGVDEKPKQALFCNAGLYVMSPELLRFVPSDRRYDMTELLSDVLREGLPVVAFPIHERWIDVGRKEHLEDANSIVRRGKVEP